MFISTNKLLGYQGNPPASRLLATWVTTSASILSIYPTLCCLAVLPSICELNQFKVWNVVRWKKQWKSKVCQTFSLPIVFPSISWLSQWFLTFFSSRHTKDQRKFDGTFISKSFVKYFKKSIFFPKKIWKSKEQKFSGTLGRSSRHTRVPRHTGWETLD